MRFNRPTLPTTPAGSGGQSGIPSWRRKWIENQVRWVLLECSHIEDINDRTLTFINSFDGAEIDCVECSQFVKVKRTLKSKYKRERIPDTPLF